jgi:hypothetical protein
MADDKDKPQPSWWNPTSWFPVIRRNQPASDLPPPALPPLQQSVWVPDQVWEPPMRRNNALYESQPPFVPAPPEPPPPPAVSNAPLSGASMGMVTGRAELTLTEAPGVTTPTDAQAEAIEARFQEALRRAADLTSFIDQLRKASTGREIGPGHNQGPPLPIEEVDNEVEHLIALLRDRGPKTKGTVDLKPLIEQTEKTKSLSERIWSWSKTVGLALAMMGANEVAKDLTKPLWEELAQKISDFCLAIMDYVSLLLM